MSIAKQQVAPLSPLPPSSFPAFDYGSMAADEVEVLQRQADKIRKLDRSMTETVIELGRELIDVKNKLPHGQFGKWLESECRFDKRSAQNYINAAQLAEGKNETVSLLPPALVYKLASKTAPAEIVSDVLDRAGKGEAIDQRKVEARLSEARYQRKVEVKKERKGEARKKAAEREKRWKAEEEKRKEAARKEEERQQQAAKAILERLGIEDVRFLLDQLGEASLSILPLLKKEIEEHGAPVGGH
jgi:hypothetical protein